MVWGCIVKTDGILNVVMDWSPRSPVLNIIEAVWNNVGRE